MKQPKYSYRLMFADMQYYKSKHDYASVDCIAVEYEIDATVLTAEDVYYLAEDHPDAFVEITLNDWVFLGRVSVEEFIAEECPYTTTIC